MPPTFTPVETERLILRRFEARDVEPFHAYRADPAVARYQGWSDYTRQDAEAFVAKQCEVVPGSPGSAAQIAVEDKATGTMIGDVFLFMPENGRTPARIGYTLAPAWQGRGLATEAVRALLDRAFGVLALHRITALVDTRNASSIALLERLGFRREAHHVESYRDGDAWTDEYVYALLQREWRAR